MTEPPSPRAILEAQAVSYETGSQRLLSDVSLELLPGEVLAIVGPNGAGKTTLLRLLAGILRPTCGAVVLDGRPLGAYRPEELALRRAVMPQQSLLRFGFTAREVVAMGRYPHQRARQSDRLTDERVIARAMAETETHELADRLFPTLSGGEQGRVTLARVLAQDTPVLLLDEPTASLDIRHQHGMLALAQKLARRGAAIAVILHDLNLAAAYADRIALLCAGQLADLGPPRAVLRESLLTEVFRCPIAVRCHPLSDCPLILPIAERAAAPDSASPG